jgi:FtsP/CotA-like multicopper oxidase with cupredoxin domain
MLGTLTRSRFAILTLFALCSGGVPRSVLAQAPNATPEINTYYVAADEVEWNYAPSGMNKMMGMKFEGYATVFTEQGPHRIGTTYRKAIFREYTDGTFTKLKARGAEWEHLGLLGPLLRAEVGDTIRVVFKNNGTHPYSMHPHGVFYDKDFEGSAYEDGTATKLKKGGVVPPGETHTYNWQVPERAGPGPNDPSSIVWLYHSHAEEPKDVMSGLVGAIIVTRRGMAGADGKPKDVDREFVNLFLIFNENDSWYLDHNIQTYTSDPKGVDKLEFIPKDDKGEFSFIGTGFAVANGKATINGYMYGNLPMMTMKKGERVRWYLMSNSNEDDVHAPHWHGQTVLFNNMRTDTLSMGPMAMIVADMVPDNPGTWLFHCHVNDHFDGGMYGLFKVNP